mmetsp:Transcript_33345/g.60748  ORF Transcript_33345/g.60748 Transcript_33345/m.60748 type:complete len:202 (-) Transcript_33345:923-1528(-)
MRIFCLQVLGVHSLARQRICPLLGHPPLLLLSERLLPLLPIPVLLLCFHALKTPIHPAERVVHSLPQAATLITFHSFGSSCFLPVSFFHLISARQYYHGLYLATSSGLFDTAPAAAATDASATISQPPRTPHHVRRRRSRCRLGHRCHGLCYPRHRPPAHSVPALPVPLPPPAPPIIFSVLYRSTLTIKYTPLSAPAPTPL